MSDEKTVKVAISTDNAVLLLEAAGDDSGAVQTTSDGWFLVPESVAKKAKVTIIEEEEEDVSDDVSFNPDPDAVTAATRAPAKKTASTKKG